VDQDLVVDPVLYVQKLFAHRVQTGRERDVQDVVQRR